MDPVRRGQKGSRRAQARASERAVALVEVAGQPTAGEGLAAGSVAGARRFGPELQVQPRLASCCLWAGLDDSGPRLSPQSRPRYLLLYLAVFPFVERLVGREPCHLVESVLLDKSVVMRAVRSNRF